MFENEEAQQFIAYDCLCLKSTLTLNYIVMEGEYKTLLNGAHIPDCGILCFHFDGLDSCFTNCKITVNNMLEECNKWTMFEENGKRKIVVKLKDVNSFEAMRDILVKVREYFEFVVDHELIIDEIKYKGINGEGIEIIRDDKITSEKSFVFHDRTVLETDIIFDDLNKWLMYYEKYKEPIYIYGKNLFIIMMCQRKMFSYGDVKHLNCYVS